MSNPLGSPPHTRGKGTEPKRRGEGVGITPAHAGKSLESDKARERGKDHPRTRGEKKIYG